MTTIETQLSTAHRDLAWAGGRICLMLATRRMSKATVDEAIVKLERAVRELEKVR